jgi:hypothetical protein
MYHKTYLLNDCLLPSWHSPYWLVSEIVNEHPTFEPYVESVPGSTFKRRDKWTLRRAYIDLVLMKYVRFGHLGLGPADFVFDPQI